MDPKEEEFLRALRATFQVEAAEHLQTIATGLLDLEKTVAAAEREKLIATVFRAAHSLKGAARATDFNEIESLCQSLEDTFTSWKRENKAPTAAVLDLAHRTLNAITAALSPSGTPRVQSRSPVPPSFAAPAPAPAPVPVAPRPAAAAAPAPTPPPAPAPAKTLPADETVRITVSKLDARLVEAEEMLTAKLTTGQRAEDLRELGRGFEVWRSEWARIEPEARLLRQTLTSTATSHAAPPQPGLVRLLDFFDWFRDQTKALEGRVAALTHTAQQDTHVIGRLVDDLLKDSKKLLLLPFSSLTAPFPKLVRDLCRDQGKEADLVIRGEDVEIDKRILEEMKDPLVHLLRNSIDHGIELPARRLQAGKPARATITLEAAPVNGSKVELVISDDGAGLDLEKVKASAVKLGRLTAEEARHLDEAATQALIFQAEVSTSPEVTKLSGRGLGLAIVREKAEKLGGTVSVEGRPGQGTSFRILLPSTLATFRGVLVETAGRRFVIPTFQVERVARVKTDTMKTVEGHETIALGGRTLALVRLAAVLELPLADATDPSSPTRTVLVLGLGDQRIAFAIDAVLDEQEVLVKPLRKPLSRVRNIAGATVLASGEVAPVLNVADVLKSARKTGVAANPILPATPVAQARSVLVAEDSITSRMLLKSVLESAGYRVKTAVDGMEAFMFLRTEKFDLVVSDVEMPRLGGLDLIARIRADRRLAELPVILVSALDSREDRERGIDVGANAYIVKGRFDQSDLLAAIKRLI